MNQKNLVLGVLAALIVVLAFGTFQLIGGDQEPEETVTEGFREVSLDHEPYFAVRDSGGDVAYAGVDRENRSYVYYREKKYGPYVAVYNFWSTDDEPVYIALNTTGYRNLYHGDETVESLEEDEIVYNPQVLGGDLVYQKMVPEIDLSEYGENLSSEDTIQDIYEDFGFYSTQNTTSEYIDIKLMRDGEEVGEGFEAVLDYAIIDRQLVYRAMDDGSAFLVDDGVKQEEYSSISSLMEIGGQTAFVASEGGEEFVVHGDDTGEKYNSVSELTDVGGKPAYIAEEDDESFVVFDGEEDRRYSSYIIENLVSIDGKPGYIARKLGEEIVVAGEEASESYSRVYDLKSIGGEAVYSVFDGEDEYIVRGGEEMERFEQVDSFVGVGGEVAYTATNGDGKVFVRKGREDLGSYDEVTGPVEIGGEVAFIYSTEDSDKRQVHYGGRESRRYDSILSIADLEGRPVFVGERNKNQYLVEFIKG